MSSRKKLLWIIPAVVIVAVGLSVLASVRRARIKAPESRPAPVTAVPKAELPKEAKMVPVALQQPGLASTAGYDKLAAEDARVKPNVPDYAVKPGLANVVNFKMFKPLLDARAISLIEKNKFVITPTDYTQMFHVYENNEYQRPEKFPAFITTDSMLHTYHVFYDYTLRQVESYKLFDSLAKMTDAMLNASIGDLKQAKGSAVRDAARRNVAYFALARQVLKDAPPPDEVEKMVQTDLSSIEEHDGRELSAIFDHKVDFSQFVPRGHYTRTEKLKRFFKAMMWYGNTQFAISKAGVGPQPTRQALLVVRNLRTAKSGNEPVLKLWNSIYEPTVFYVGSADDYTYYDYAKLSDKVYGASPSIEAFEDEGKVDRFIAEVKKLPGPRIANWTADPKFPTRRQFRFMGQRFIPDSRIMQELTHPKANGRNFPKGLDVFAAMGSDRALDILETVYSVNDFSGFEEQMNKMRDEMRKTPRETWQSNLYYGWMWSLQSLPKPAPAGYPSFMRGEAWIDKCLFTGIGSWTELRHDTILYAKQSGSECGGDGEEEEPPTPKGYVEPNLEFWTKLLWLNKYTRDGLSSRALLNEELKDKFDKLDDWLDFCRRITVKELTNQKVTDEEYEQMCIYGSELEALTLSFAGGELLSDADKDMAVVADVHTSFGACMEEATGRAGAIYVVVPIEGKLYLTRGATYTQYEFMHPAADRLTDEKWQQMLNSNQEPGLAEWARSFFVETKNKPAPKFANFPGGC